jgi:hypothetical protein
VEIDGYVLWLVLTVLFDEVAPDPAVTYLLGEILYDHTRSVVGPPASNDGCGGVERQMCFTLEDAQWLDAESAPHPFKCLGLCGLAWQEGRPGLGCFGDLPVRRTTWGAIKSFYR